MNDMPHPEVAQVRTSSATTLLYRRLLVGRPAAPPKATESSTTREPTTRTPKKISNYFRACEAAHALCVPIQGEDMNIQSSSCSSSSSSSPLVWRPQTAIRSTRLATNCSFLQEVAGICRIYFFEAVNSRLRNILSKHLPLWARILHVVLPEICSPRGVILLEIFGSNFSKSGGTATSGG